jgi:hypothetical protein
VVRPPFRTTLRLYAIAIERFAELEGSYPSISLLNITPRKFCNLVFAWAVERIDPEKREEWIESLNYPLPGETVHRPSRDDLDEDARAFMSAMRKTKS